MMIPLQLFPLHREKNKGQEALAANLFLVPVRASPGNAQGLGASHERAP